MTTREQILDAAKVGEGTDWEFKAAKGGLPGSFWETYSAMANSEGGTVVLGASEDESGKIHLDGLSDEQIRKYEKNLRDGLHDRHKVSANLLSTSDITAMPVDGSQLLVVRVPRASRHQRPVFLGPHPLTGTFRRQHEGDYRCSDAEARRMLSDACEESRDSRMVEHFTLGDLDPSSLKQYRRVLEAVRGDHPWVNLPDVEFLERLGGWQQDRATGKQGPTLAALLMFGKELAIRDPAVAPNYFVDYREKLDPTTRWSDRIYPDGMWESNLFQFYGRVWPKIAVALPVPFRLEGVTRKDETAAHEALREAFVNAIVHADYAAGGGIVVERYPDRIVLSNPGTLLVSLEQYLRGGVSECRNPTLQKMFAMLGRGERAGSGVDKIVTGWRSQHWRSPLIRTQHQPDRVDLTMPLVTLLQPDTIEHLKVLFGPRIDVLTPKQVQALAIAREEGAVSNRRLQSISTEHPVEIGRMLQGLVEQGFLQSDNRRRWTTYRLVGEEQMAGAHQASLFDAKASGTRGEGGKPDSLHSQGDSIRSGGDSIRSDPLDSLHNGGDSIRNGGDSIRSDPLDSLHNGGDSIRSAPSTPEADDHLDEYLAALARPIASRHRAPTAQVRAAILQLCMGRFLSAERLGLLLRRHPVRIRHVYLKPLVTEGLLRLKFPGSTNRPDQAYTTADAPPAP